jgi:hypothetical protein
MFFLVFLKIKFKEKPFDDQHGDQEVVGRTVV